MTRPDAEFRPDIDGLRALAILLVVAYHAQIPGLRAGFFGVDVFFVISGYLITRNLIGEAARDGTVRLARFWARRVRRLVPALACAVVGTLVVGAFVLSPLELHTAVRDALSSTFYVSNITFALRSTYYFAPRVGDSLLLHTWSLGVEEQFYLLWPLLTVAAVVVARRTQRLRSVLAAILATGAVISFALALHYTARGTPWSFFGLPTRAWEFAVAGLLACAAPTVRRLPAALATPVSLAGLALIGVAAVRFDNTTLHPSTATLLPVLGACLVVVGGEGGGAGVAQRLLAVSPLQHIGRLSYAWYLWHWPAILLVVAAVGTDSIVLRVAGALAALVLAVVTHWLIENPIRFSARLAASTAKTFAVGAVATAAAVAVCAAVERYDDAALRRPLMRRLSAAEHDTRVRVGVGPLGCRWVRRSQLTAYCDYGGANASYTVVLVGDSHADHWVPGLVSAARATGVRLIVRTANGCPAIDVPTVQFLQLAGGGDCEAFRRGTRTVLQTVRPDAVVVSESIYAGRLASPGGSRVGATGEVSTWRRALRGYVASMRAAGIQVGLVTSSPHWPFDPLACIGRGGSIRECEVSVDRATTGVKPFRDIELALGTEGVATLFDVIPELCGPARCRLEVDGHLVYRDTSHLTATYAEHEAPQLAEFLTRLRAR